MRNVNGYPSAWTYVEDQLAHKKTREEIIQGLVQAGYTKRQAEKTYVSYRRRYFRVVEHMNGKHDSVPGGCKHWMPKGFVRKEADILPTLPGDVYHAHVSEDPSDWLSFVGGGEVFPRELVSPFATTWG